MLFQQQKQRLKRVLSLEEELLFLGHKQLSKKLQKRWKALMKVLALVL